MFEELNRCPVTGNFTTGSDCSCEYRMFDRTGGSGTGTYSTQNISYSVGDDPSTVSSNRDRVKRELRVPYLLSAHQVHGNHVYCLNSPLRSDVEIDGCDALITDQPGVGLLIQQADCQAVLLFDPVHKVIGAIHSGWRGSVINIIAETVEKMISKFGTVPRDIHAKLSPSLGPCCAEFINCVTDFPPDFFKFEVKPNHFDFWQISRQQLVGSGIKPGNIECAGICTSCSENYFSYRRAVRGGCGVTGRNSSLMFMN